MTTTTTLRQLIGAFVVTSLTIVIAPELKAACRAHTGGTLAPELRNLQELPAPGQEDFSDQAALPEAADREEKADRDRNDSNDPVLGLWKVIYFADGVLNDVGLEHFNAGGTELVNDVGALDGGTNFCIGAWKKVRARSYKIVHPFFVFDDSGKKVTAICIVTSFLVAARDGNTFRGKWSQDNYDLSGNLIPGNHFDGPFTGTRIAPERPFPFPIPF